MGLSDYHRAGDQVGYPKNLTVTSSLGGVIGVVTTTGKGHHWAHSIYDKGSHGKRFRLKYHAVAHLHGLFNEQPGDFTGPQR